MFISTLSDIGLLLWTGDVESASFWALAARGRAFLFLAHLRHHRDLTHDGTVLDAAGPASAGSGPGPAQAPMMDCAQRVVLCCIAFALARELGQGAPRPSGEARRSGKQFRWVGAPPWSDRREASGVLAGAAAESGRV